MYKSLETVRSNEGSGKSPLNGGIAHCAGSLEHLQKSSSDDEEMVTWRISS